MKPRTLNQPPNHSKDRTIVQLLRTISFRVAAGLLVLCLTAALQCRVAAADEAKTFKSPDDAANAVVDALRKNDRPVLLTIFGSDSKGLLDSGDPVADKNYIDDFLKNYDQMHRFSHGPDGKLFLIVGAENWPMPIPLEKTSAGWRFDTPYGKKELLFRRIGGNEISAIRVLNAVVQGQHEYFDQKSGDGSTSQYAQKILSDEGKHDGLYWKIGANEKESPIGPLVADASKEGYGANSRGNPFHGYYFKMLTAQGANEPGGARSYVVDGKMTGGFAVLAYQAEYRSSGVMTFLVDANGNVLEKDLGPKTKELASAIDSYNPDKSWHPAE